MHTFRDWFPLVFLAFFVGLWVTVCFILSRMGWQGFAQKYAAASRPAGRSFNCRSARFGTRFAGYRNVMRMVFCAAGIYIYPQFLFRAFHDPFLIPWDKVVGITERKFLQLTWRELEIRDGDQEIHASLSEAALREYEKFSKV